MRQRRTPVPRQRETIKDISECESQVTVSAAANYPFSSISPDINYSVTYRFTRCLENGSVTIETSGSHNRFPYYESLIDGSNNYKYKSPDDGPGIWNLGIIFKKFEGDVLKL